MKRQFVVISITILMLSGCTASPAPAPAPEVTPTPTPTAMSIAEAGEFYLATVCPGNEAFNVLNSALQAGDLAAITSAAATTHDLYETSAHVFGDATVLWPVEISSEDLKLAEDRNQAFAGLFGAVSSSQSVDEAYGTVNEWEAAPDQAVRDDGLAAAKRIRALLELSEDTDEGC